MNLRLDAQQVLAAASTDRHTVCLAPAGSGKTLVLAMRAVYAYLSPDSDGQLTAVDQVAALTFTVEAGGLLRRRLHQVLNEVMCSGSLPTISGQRILNRREREHLRTCRDRLDQAEIGTIDSFCNTHVRMQAGEAGIPPQARLASEVEMAQAAERAWVTFRRMPGVWEAVAESIGPWQFADALPAVYDRMQALLKPKVAGLPGDPARTIIALRQTQLLHAAAVIEALRRMMIPPVLRAAVAAVPALPADAQGIQAWLRSVDRISGRGVRFPHVMELVRALQADLDYPNPTGERRGSLAERARRGSLSALIAWDGAPSADVTPLVDACLSYRDLVDAALAEAGLVSFARIEHAMHALVEKKQAGIGRLRHLLVDEAQDCNALQLGLADACAAAGATLLVVGDDRQSIYGFRHAAPELLLDMARREAGDQHWLTVRLRRNYRSHPALVSAIGAAFARGYAGETFRMDEVEAGRTDMDSDDRVERVRIVLPVGVGRTTTQAAQIEAAILARQIADRIAAGVEPSSIAVLFRTRTRMHHYARALDRVGVPYDTDYRGGFLAAQEVADVLAVLRLALCPHDREALAIAAAGPWGPDTLTDRRATVQALMPGGDPGTLLTGRLAGAVERTRLSVQTDGVHAALRALIYDPVCAAWAAGLPGSTRRLANLEILLGVVDQLAAQGRTQPREILQEFAERRRLDLDLAEASGAAVGGRGVRLLSYHAAKGLEWDTVILPEADRTFDLRDLRSGVISATEGGDLVVAMRPTDGIDLAHSLVQDRVAQRSLREEARLLYVACTRARDHLLVVACARQEQEASDCIPNPAQWFDPASPYWHEIRISPAA